MKNIQSSIAGTVFTILVTIGEKVAIGQTVILIESMKMEIPIEAGSVGKVQDIKVAVGDFVNEGDILIELE